MSASPDPRNIQANILCGSSKWEWACYVFLRVDIRNSAAALVGGLLASEYVGSAASVFPDTPEVNINIAFSHEGLEVAHTPISDAERYQRTFIKRKRKEEPLPLAADDGEEKGSAFEFGMYSAKINDIWPQRYGDTYQWPDRTDANAWWADDRDPEPWKPVDEWPHVLVWVSATSEESRGEALDEIRKLVESIEGVTKIGCQFAHALDDAREHFGFVDGVSQPAIEGFRSGNPGDGKLSARGWQSLPVGEFIVGYPDEGLGSSERLQLAPAARDGTFLVYRKLEQDVEAFRKASASMADASTMSQEKIEEKMMGRRHDGAPLNVAPGSPNPPADRSLWNDFTYANDPDGAECPFGSHVRRSNPRDDLHFEGRRVNRHRIIRRGMPYGEPYAEGEASGQEKRGLVFIAFNARIEDQFEFIQKNWLNGGRTFRLGDDADPIAGNGESIRVVINGERPVLHTQAMPFTKFMGGDYFFVPSISMLQEIAAGG
jgi:Dyp-type peroxidase family